jgi:hypothetical protein
MVAGTLLMRSYLLWSMIPATLVAGFLESWLGIFGIFATFVIVFIGWIIWVKLDM